ncbi:MAG: argininosuccinate lyase [Deltaproteobacteria bacterium]|nr:argininosuccinate lyase [Deltaproteobacteria bacterium]
MSATKRQIWGGHLQGSPDALMVSFCSGRDVSPVPMADAVLLPFDLWTNRAHALMLARRGILPLDLLGPLLGALNDLEDAWRLGTFQLDPALEDVHVNVERYVSARAGADIGGRLHTARSRNDQVVCDMRLYLRAALLELGHAVCGLARGVLDQAQTHADTVMPGFTHHQPAMITTWGHWLAGYAQGLCRDLERIGLALTLVNRNPLGAAASFGTSWPIERELTASLLGFSSVDANTMDCINARWEHETQAAHTYALLMNHLSAMSQDLILLSHPYWGLLELPDKFVTGSSIMPQKRNPDLAEVIKGKAAWVGGMVGGLLSMPKGNMSGFNRDTQWTKYAIMDVVRECQPAPVLLEALYAELKVNAPRMRERLNQGYPEAADFADALARALKLPFRASYDIAAAAVRKSGGAGRIQESAAREALSEAGHDPATTTAILSDLAYPERILGWRDHTGSPHPAQVRQQVSHLRAQVGAQSQTLTTLGAGVEAAWERCRTLKA